MFLQKTSFAAAMVAGVLLVSPGAALAADKPADDDPPKPESQPRPRDDGQQAPDFGPMAGQLERLQKELDLTPEQVQKLQDFGLDMQDRIMEGIQRFQQEGFPQGEELQKLIEGFRGGVEGRLGEILTPEQQEKLRGMMGNFGQQFGDQFGGGDPGEGLRRVRELGRNARLEQIKDALLLSEEEQKVLLPLIEKVMDAQAELRTTQTEGRAELTRFLRSGPDKDAVEGRMNDFRAKRDEVAKKLEAARKELRELLTLEQEAKLIAFGILD